jgi:hypothetical protein
MQYSIFTNYCIIYICVLFIESCRVITCKVDGSLYAYDEKPVCGGQVLQGLKILQ